MHLAIDPGITTGWALFSGEGELVDCGIGSPPRRRYQGVLIERPRIYPHGRTKNPNDVLSVAINAGEWAGYYRALGCPVTYVEPAKWKGQIPKDVHHARIFAKLTPKEQGIMLGCAEGIARSKRHNMVDAVGLGLFQVSR
jgi:hypothetical protein